MFEEPGALASSLYHLMEGFVWQVIETGSGGKRWWDITECPARSLDTNSRLMEG